MPQGLDFTVLAQFQDHDGFDGIILGHPQQPYHLEFTTQRGHQVGKAPTQDHVLVFYLPDQDGVGSRLCPDARSRVSTCPLV